MYNVDNAVGVYVSETTQKLWLEKEQNFPRTWWQGQCGYQHDRKCISTDIYLLPGKLFGEKFIRVDLLVSVELETNQDGKQNWHLSRKHCILRTVPARLLWNPHSSPQITDHYPSAVKPWTCAIKLDPLLFSFFLTVYIAWNLRVTRFAFHSRYFLKTVSVFDLEINQRNHNLWYSNHHKSMLSHLSNSINITYEFMPAGGL